jgi:hypothetical protein
MNNYFHRTAHGRRDTTIFSFYNAIYTKNPLSIEVFLICPNTNASFPSVFSSVYLIMGYMFLLNLFVTVVLASCS